MTTPVTTVTPYRMEPRPDDGEILFKYAHGAIDREEAMSGKLTEAYRCIHPDHPMLKEGKVVESVRRDGPIFRRKLSGYMPDNAPAAAQYAVERGAAYRNALGEFCLTVPFGKGWKDTIGEWAGKSDHFARNECETFAFEALRGLSLIDGDFHAVCREPVWRVERIEIKVRDRTESQVRAVPDVDMAGAQFEREIANGRIFRADRRNEAVTYAEKMAAAQKLKLGRHGEIRISPGPAPSLDVVTSYLRKSCGRMLLLVTDHVLHGSGRGFLAANRADLIRMLAEENPGVTELAPSAKTFAAGLGTKSPVFPEELPETLARVLDACGRAERNGMLPAFSFPTGPRL